MSESLWDRIARGNWESFPGRSSGAWRGGMDRRRLMQFAAVRAAPTTNLEEGPQARSLVRSITSLLTRQGRIGDLVRPRPSIYISRFRLSPRTSQRRARVRFVSTKSITDDKRDHPEFRPTDRFGPFAARLERFWLNCNVAKLSL